MKNAEGLKIIGEKLKRREETTNYEISNKYNEEKLKKNC